MPVTAWPLWLLVLGVGAAAAAPAPPPAERFARLPLVAELTLAPDGRFAAGRLRVGDTYAGALLDLDRADPTPRVVTPPGVTVQWFAWKPPGRLLVGVRGGTPFPGMPARVAGVLVVPLEGGAARWLGIERASDLLLQRVDLVDRLPDSPDEVLLALTSAEAGRPRVYRVDVTTGQRLLVQGAHPGISRFTADAAGRVRVGQGIHAPTVARRTFVRAPGQRRWELLREDPLAAGIWFAPVLFDATDPDVLVVQSNHAGGTVGLYRYRLSTRQFIGQLFQDPEVDLGTVVLDGADRQVLGVEFDRDVHASAWFEPRAAGIVAAARAALGLADIRLMAVDAGFRRAIVYAQAPDVPGRYVVMEGNRPPVVIARDFPDLEDVPLAPMQAVSFAARDGVRIPGYLSTPAGAPPGGRWPAVVLPHGGPESRDMAQFVPLVQLLASRGIAVLQLNFRGSSGYGTAFEQAGRRQWGRAMQDDVTDGTRWLVASGVADPRRVCIVGWSYGGYAALMGVAREPDLYRCAASIAGVSDLPRLARDNSASYVTRALTALRIGRLAADGERLVEHSPVERAAAITAPVLLVHGNRDAVVAVGHSRSMRRALVAAGRPVTYVEIDGGDHALSAGDQRRRLYESLDAFLGEHLAPGS